MSNILTNRWAQAVAAALVLIVGFFTYQSNNDVTEENTTAQVETVDTTATQKVVTETTDVNENTVDIDTVDINAETTTETTTEIQ